jgi:uncharacterized protein YfaS (alpha-2-macroglobulin family)
MAKYRKSETIIYKLEITDEEDNYADPQTSVTITIHGPDGAIIVGQEGKAMTREDVGRYSYRYNPGADAETGYYIADAKVVDSGGDTTQIQLAEEVTV